MNLMHNRVNCHSTVSSHQVNIYMPPYRLQRQTYACQAFPMEHIMKQPNAYKMVDQTTKQTMALKTPLCIKSHIHKIKNMHHTYNNPILRPSRNTVNIQ